MTSKIAEREYKVGGIKAFIAQAAYEVMTDPDLGMELSEQAKKRLRSSRHSKEKRISLADIKKKYY